MNKHSFTLFFISIAIFSYTLKAQNQASKWYFGNYAGLDFNAEKVSLLTDGQVVSENLRDAVSEGTTSVADTLGNLMFYSNGVDVWNRLHQKMPRGTGLAGNNSTTQTLAVPHPADKKLYYIFTASPQGNNCIDTTFYSFSYNQKVPGFWYSIIDMSADNGLGDIVVKNVRLVASTTEKMCATLHENGQDIWVMMHEWNSNTFRAYRLTRDTYLIDTNAVISCVGMIHTGGTIYYDREKPYSSEDNVIGQTKFSLDGTRLALAISDTSRVEVFNFDKKTGVVTPFVTLTNIQMPYGLEFSASGRFLYVSGISEPRTIVQYDLQAEDIERSIYELSKTGIGLESGSLQLGPDHKIYYANFSQPFLPVITNPDSLGKSCGYQPEGIYLEGKVCSVGLPNFPTFFLTYPEPVVDMPNVFTPNGDGKNELFTPIDIRFVTKANTVIYNRWGELVYQTLDPLIRWTGTNFSTGIYYWQMEYEGKTKKKYIQKGTLSLLR